jgi:hypothetical protein
VGTTLLVSPGGNRLVPHEGNFLSVIRALIAHRFGQGASFVLPPPQYLRGRNDDHPKWKELSDAGMVRDSNRPAFLGHSGASIPFGGDNQIPGDSAEEPFFVGRMPRLAWGRMQRRAQSQELRARVAA